MKGLHRSTFAFFILSLIIGALVVVLHFRTLPPQIPLFYSRPQGEEQITDMIFIFILPLLNLFFVTVNNLMLKRFFKENEFIATIINIVNITVVIFFTYVFIKIIFLVA